MDSRGNRDEEAFFERLAQAVRPGLRAPSRLKSRIYSGLMRQAAESGPLRSLTATESAGHELCVFEKFVQILPLGAKLDSVNYCRFCHGRVLGERIEGAPIPWNGCPYAEFQRH